MSYATTRDQEYLHRLDGPINDFITRYNANPSSKDRQTIILFPGAMGSRLVRANAPYEDGPPFSYDTVWLNCSILFEPIEDLQMQSGMDYQKHIIIPDGPVDFLNIQPYDRFIQWCDDNGLDWFVFGCDWRRRIPETVNFFLQTFLPTFRQRVANSSPIGDPLQNFTLIGHCFGGMIVKLILNQSSNQYVTLLKRAVTVATPFYGYGGQVHRYFKGDPDLNFKGASTVTRVVSTLPAGYEGMFLDEDTYKLYKSDLAKDPKYPLAQYPSTDANDGTVADPYKPGTNGKLVRYPSNYGFDSKELAFGKIVHQQLAAPLDSTVNKKFFNLRGVQFRIRKVIHETVNCQTWAWIPTNFNPDRDSDPIIDARGPGDNTIPAWSARLVSTPKHNIRTIRADIDHMFIMNEDPLLTELAKVLELKRAKMKPKTRQMLAKPKVATRMELNSFVDDLTHLNARHKDETPAKRKQAVLKYLETIPREQLQDLLGRAFIDAMTSPSQKASRGIARRPRPKQ
jgi:hypothetical protein